MATSSPQVDDSSISSVNEETDQSVLDLSNDTNGKELLQSNERPLRSASPTKLVEPSIVADLSEDRTRPSGTVLPSAFRQLRSQLMLCFGMIPLSILLFLYVYASLVVNNPPLGPLLFSPSRTILVVTILSQGIAILLRMLFSCVFESLRWHFASRNNGIAATTFLGLSPATSSLGVMKLLYAGGLSNHMPWSIQRY